MPKLRRLNGNEVIKILEQLGFEVIRVRGSHHILRRNVKGQNQTVNIPVHGSKPLATGMLKRIYRDLLRYISEEDLSADFYSE